MPSPFPGMNPYLEQKSVWWDFHNSFLTALRDDLAAAVDPDYYVALGEHIYIHEWPLPPALSDLGIVEQPAPRRVRNEPGVAIAEPRTDRAIVSYPSVEEERSIFLEVRNREAQRVVTVIELLSPSNKYSGPDREQYLLERQTLLSRSIHFVEFDLLRGGPRMPTGNVPDSDYSVLVSRAERRPFGEYWAIGLRERLPVIPVPLSADDADVALDLQVALHRVYDAARYGTRVYRGTPEPALSPADADWAKQFVPAQV